jgi:2-polyprenyl-6-hydroxyphenyl methylase/3-demethylubiquinone-9 3-methyltransferase
VSATAASSTDRFGFGSNWSRYLSVVDDDRIRLAGESLIAALGPDALAGSSFLDAGCGSGLFSLAALRHGAARVHSFDFDPDSVECARALRDRYQPDTQQWRIERGDVLDRGYLAGLGQFEIVYSWGVLHHTGKLDEACANVAELVGDGGLLYVSIYNDQGRPSRLWRRIKRTYNHLPENLRVPYAVLVMAPFELRTALGATLRGAPGSYLRLWTEPRVRGMSRWYDLLDWVGGYPFEVANVEHVFRLYRERGFELQWLLQATSGCNQFVFRRGAR